MEFIKEHRILLLAYLILVLEVLLFRDSVLPLAALAVLLALLILKVVNSEIPLRYERLINVFSICLVLITSIILILKAL